MPPQRYMCAPWNQGPAFMPPHSRARRECARGATPLGVSARGGGRVFLAELVDAPGRVDHLLLAGIERMAVRTNIDLQVLAHGGARLKGVAAAAADGDLAVLRMDRRFHDCPSLPTALRLPGRASS